MVSQYDLLEPPTQASQAFVSLLLKDATKGNYALNTKKAVTGYLRRYVDMAENSVGGNTLLVDAKTDAVKILTAVREAEKKAAQKGGGEPAMLADVPPTNGKRQASVSEKPAAASAAGSREPSKKSPQDISPGSAARQAVPDQTLPTAEPSGPSNAANTTPSFTAGPMITRGFELIEVSPYDAKVRQIETDVNKNLDLAKKHEPDLRRQMEYIAQGLGDVRVDVRVKSGPRVQEKVAIKGAQRTGDFLAGRWVVDTPDDLTSIVERVAGARYRIIEKEITLDGAGAEWGWRDAKLQIEVEKGFTAEVQIVPKPMVDVSEGPGHKIYEKWHAEDLSAPLPEQRRIELENDKLTSRKLYNNAMLKFMTSKKETQKIPVTGEVRGEVSETRLNELRLATQRQVSTKPEALTLQDSLNGDLTLQASDVKMLDDLSADSVDDLEKMVQLEVDRLSGVSINERQRIELAAADDMLSRLPDVQNAIKAAAGCILKG
jgi:hypothetical protein